MQRAGLGPLLAYLSPRKMLHLPTNRALAHCVPLPNTTGTCSKVLSIKYDHDNEVFIMTSSKYEDYRFVLKVVSSKYGHFHIVFQMTSLQYEEY